jgi:hypothetical protein
MPTIGRLGRLRVVVYPNDHRPAHIHVIGHGHEAVFQLNCPDGPPVLRENHGFSRTELGRAKTALAVQLRDACSAWEAVHGDWD